uniref:VWFA domain-containing protein n=1 Tax=Panagrolaimus davidi TaxID=227884 RepID=A0A914P8D5_9BILA
MPNTYGTLCSTKTSQAWLDIIFIIDTATSMSIRKLQQLSGELATILKDFNFNQNGDHTIRAGIIIYSSTFTTLFELNNITNFAGFEKVLISLSKYYDAHDFESNVYGALDAGYRLLQIQKSHRVPLIVLVSATYNALGFKGTSQLSKSIKGNGTNIVAINFAPENSDLAIALQNIVSPTYYYVSTQDDLDANLRYAFTQLNCICPSDYKQFRLFNPAWNNYTNFADCLSGVPGETDPLIANTICNANGGILLSLTNFQIFNFTTDIVIPYDLKGVKKFSIGLHKSDFDGQWKWWNYDGSETVMGDYPTMSNPDPNDNYGYMWNYKGLNWKLQTGNEVPLPYICQYKACDAENFCENLKFSQNN